MYIDFHLRVILTSRKDVVQYIHPFSFVCHSHGLFVRTIVLAGRFPADFQSCSRNESHHFLGGYPHASSRMRVMAVTCRTFLDGKRTESGDQDFLLPVHRLRDGFQHGVYRRFRFFHTHAASGSHIAYKFFLVHWIRFYVILCFLLFKTSDWRPMRSVSFHRPDRKGRADKSLRRPEQGISTASSRFCLCRGAGVRKQPVKGVILPVRKPY